MESPRSIPRPEHPRPQFHRERWLNLNGPWTCHIDNSLSGKERGLVASRGFEQTITVPFCPESRLSGVAHTDFIEAIWYHRTITVPGSWAGARTLLHFGGVDWCAEVYIDGHSAGTHYGGSSPFTLDITAFVKPGATHHVVVHVRDNTRSGLQPIGKQCTQYQSCGCSYTRTTGIWQTVWLEAVGAQSLESVHIVGDLAGARFVITPHLRSCAPGLSLRVRATLDGVECAAARQCAAQGVPLVLNIANPRAWSPQSPTLYELELVLLDHTGSEVDRVNSYGGLRDICIDGDRILLNGAPVYLRLVLDQGFYPEGIWTAPADRDLQRDIELSMAAGFNGARLHQKAFEERFHYWADRMGYLTWAESPSWGFDITNPSAARNFLTEWSSLVARDRNHPSVIAWTPLNETAFPTDTREHNRVVREAALITRQLDPTRPVNDASGWHHQDTDLWTVHDYTQDPAVLRERLERKPDGTVMRNFPEREVEYAGQPYLVDEFGGVKWIAEGRSPNAANSWGYGDAPRDLEELYVRLKGQVAALRSLEHIRGFCYTQLTDVEQEQNGIYNYDRSPKFDMARIREAFTQ